MSRERTTVTRKSSDETAHPGRGMAGLAIAWKVAAVLPLVLTGAVLAGRIDLGGDGANASPRASLSVIDDRTPGALSDRDRREVGDDDKGDKKRDKRSGSPSDDPTSASPTATPSTTDPTPNDPDPTSPSSSPTKSPTKHPSPSPTDTPTPDEAAEQCEEEGVNPLDLPAMAACIADVLDGD